jgi:oligopeptide transport system substrate-binding protein
LPRLAALLMALLTVLLLGGCTGADDQSQSFSYDLPGAIDSLDPQFAQGAGSRLIILNCFEGLLRLSDTGEPEPGVADYTVSADGLRYDFEIFPTARWSDGSPLVADDFLFTFERIFSPATPSPYVGNFMSLLNAEAVLSGERPFSDLGVRVTDERRISFYLSEPNAAFPAQLTGAAAMPCKRDFFTEQRGRYGLEQDKLLTCGPFKVTRWDSRRVVLGRDEGAQNPALPESVTLYLNQTDAESRFEAGRTDFWLGSGERSFGTGYTVQSFYDKTFVLAFNQQLAPFKDAELRRALVSVLDRAAIEEAIGGTRIPALAILPPAAQLSGQNYRDLAGQPAWSASHGDPRALLFAAYERLGIDGLPPLNLMLTEGTDMALGSVMQQAWQQRLSAYIDIRPLPAENLIARVQEGQYQLAILPATAGSAGSPSAVLQALGGHGGRGLLGAEMPELEQLIIEAQAATTPRQAAVLYRAGEELLMGDFALWPIYHSATAFVSAPGVGGAVYLPRTGVLYFRSAHRG